MNVAHQIDREFDLALRQAGARLVEVPALILLVQASLYFGKKWKWASA